MLTQSPGQLFWVQWLLVAAQLITLVALVVYVMKTWHMASATERAARATRDSVEEMRVARREASDPRVFIYLAESRGSLAQVVIENLGESTASDVTFTFDPELTASQHAEVARRFFTVPMILPPRSRRAHTLDVWPSYFAANLPEQYSVTVQYRRLGEDQFRTERQVLDVGSFKYLLRVNQRDLHDLATDVHDLAERFRRWTDEEKHTRGIVERKRQFVPQTAPLVDAISHLLALWRLRTASHEAEEVSLFDSDFLPGLRLHCVAAILAAERESAAPEIKETLTEVFLGLTHRGWRHFGREEAPTVLAHAMDRLAAQLSDQLAPASRATQATTPSIDDLDGRGPKVDTLNATPGPGTLNDGDAPPLTKEESLGECETEGDDGDVPPLSNG